MWPFKKKRLEPGFWVSCSMPGIKRLEDGSFEMDFTEAEKSSISSYLKMIQGMADEEAVARDGEGASAVFHPDTIPIFQALGLWQYARGLLLDMDFESTAEVRLELTTKITASLTKAYSLSGFPIFLYDLAHAYDSSGDANAGELYSEFLDKNRHYKRSAMYDLYLQERNLEECVAEAKKKVR